jgi:hypothetical protein
VDVAPKQKTTPRQKVAQLVRLFGTTERGERVSAWRALERTMEGTGVDWSDVGNWIEQGSAQDDSSKYSEAEMQEFAQAARAEGVEAGIKIGATRAGGGNSNGHLTLPGDSVMADYCCARRGRLEAKHHNFIDEMPVRTRRRALTLKEKGYLASLYIQLGGRI